MITRRRTIAALATVLASAGVAVGSGASFTSESASASNTFSAGTLVQSNDKNGLVIVSGSNMKPGDVKTGTVKIKNTGTLGGRFVLSETNATNGFTAGSLTLKIADPANGTVYEGDLGKVPAGGIALGDFGVDEERTYNFTVTLQSSAPNADQGKSAAAVYRWDATVTP